jgi:hypothetical protein
MQDKQDMQSTDESISPPKYLFTPGYRAVQKTFTEEVLQLHQEIRTALLSANSLGQTFNLPCLSLQEEIKEKSDLSDLKLRHDRVNEKIELVNAVIRKLESDPEVLEKLSKQKQIELYTRERVLDGNVWETELGIHLVPFDGNDNKCVIS